MKKSSPKECPAPWERVISCRNTLDTMSGNTNPQTMP